MLNLFLVLLKSFNLVLAKPSSMKAQCSSKVYMTLNIISMIRSDQVLFAKKARQQALKSLNLYVATAVRTEAVSLSPDLHLHTF